MAEKLRSDYMSEVAARNASGLQKIKALQRRFQTDDLLFLHTRMDRRIYRVCMVASVAAIGISLFSLFRMATGQMPPKRE
ncbi:hypothetical protein GBAR_LOCUS4397 [Geodia barretti]|jgi:hypothetical protein|uniref:Uncharacterized protein n=1 Tax=Geodia barretti TaxID=519541 RepID=A0AA35R6L0_GEOBA|nr:hypothetical protein GBAR_LOCUS4397 [Geodia barretti]